MKMKTFHCGLRFLNLSIYALSHVHVNSNKIKKHKVNVGSSK